MAEGGEEEVVLRKERKLDVQLPGEERMKPWRRGAVPRAEGARGMGTAVLGVSKRSSWEAMREICGHEEVRRWVKLGRSK